MAKIIPRKETHFNFLQKKETFKTKGDLKETQKVVEVSLDLGLPKRDPSGSSGTFTSASSLQPKVRNFVRSIHNSGFQNSNRYGKDEINYKVRSQFLWSRLLH